MGRLHPIDHIAAIGALGMDRRPVTGIECGNCPSGPLNAAWSRYVSCWAERSAVDRPESGMVCMESQKLVCPCGHSWERPAPGPVPDNVRELCPVCTPGPRDAGAETVGAGPGDAIIIPAQELFELSNASDSEPASLIVTTTVGMQATMDGNTFPPPWSL